MLNYIGFYMVVVYINRIKERKFQTVAIFKMVDIHRVNYECYYNDLFYLLLVKFQISGKMIRIRSK
jgi:hypothetical protein